MRLVLRLGLIALVFTAGFGTASLEPSVADDDPRLAMVASPPPVGFEMEPVEAVRPVPRTAPPSSTTTTTTTLPPLPVPEPLPLDPYAPDARRPIGRIAIPAIDLDWELRQGMTLTQIDRGPSHWPGTALPGELGNAVIGGHRATFGAPFRHLDALEAGDEILLTTEDGEFSYLVTETFIVEPTDLWIADQGRSHIVTLFACHPVGSAAQRIVVRAELEEVPAG